MTDDEIKREREAFEPWALSEDFNLKRSPTYPENYIYSDTSSAFEGWLGRAILAASAPNPSAEPVAYSFERCGIKPTNYPVPQFANPSDKQEAVAEIVRYETFTGRTAWDIKIRDKSLEHGTLLYAAPLAQSAEQDRIDVLQQVVNVLFHQTSLDGAQRAVREMLIEAKGASK